jgi:hypothetical protein
VISFTQLFPELTAFFSIGDRFLKATPGESCHRWKSRISKSQNQQSIIRHILILCS